MKTLTLSTGVAVALAFGAVSAIAQLQQKSPEDKGGAQTQVPQAQPKKQESGPQGAEKAEPKEKAAQPQPQGKATKGTAEKAAEPKDKATKGTAQKATEPKDKATKGTAEKATEPKDKATKGSAERATEPKDKAAKGAEQKGSAGRVQLSEQQRTNVSQTLLKDQRVNRVTNVNVSVNVGTRVQRSVRLVALPASVISIVPQYRSYRYFVVDERICIVDPSSYEIVDIITVSDRTADRSDRSGPTTLVLTEEEKSIILNEVDMSGGSTLALGALTEGAEVPRDVELRVFSATIVHRVPKVKDYKFFTAENRVAIVDPRGAKVQLVIERRR